MAPLFVIRRDWLRRLAEYMIARHDPALVGSPRRLTALLENVDQRQAALIARRMNVGFIHSVMNTDNMTLSGEPIDYSPPQTTTGRINV